MVPATDRVARYTLRLEAELERLASPEPRRAFLLREQAKWLIRYEEWARAVDSGEDPGDVTAYDYVLTLLAINTFLVEVM